MRKLLQTEAINTLKENHPDFDFSEFIYEGTSKKGKVTCSKGHSWYASYDSLKSKKKHGCPKCAGNGKLTQEEAIRNLKQKHPMYDFSNFSYKNARTPSLVKCEKGHSWYVSYYSSMTGCGCPECVKERKPEMKRLKPNVVFENLKKIHPDYDFSEFIYEGTDKKSKVICSKGHIWYTSYGKLIIGHGCLKCQTRTQEEAIKNLKEKKPEYDFSFFEYKGSNKKSMIICDKGHIFQMKYCKIMEGVGCPECKISKGEYRIKKYLEKNGLEFETQKTYFDAKYKDFLRWDFYLPKYNLLIEYNGRQHYEFVARFHKNLMGFRVQLERDIIKKNYAIKNGIRQFTISYEKYKDIESELENYLKSIDSV